MPLTGYPHNHLKNTNVKVGSQCRRKEKASVLQRTLGMKVHVIFPFDALVPICYTPSNVFSHSDFVVLSSTDEDGEHGDSGSMGRSEESVFVD